MNTYLRSWSLQPQAGKYPHLQLWNDGPATIYPKQIIVASNVALDFGILFFDNKTSFLPITDPSLGGAGNEHGIKGDGGYSPCGAMYGAQAIPLVGGQLITAHVQLWDTQHFNVDGWELPTNCGICVRGGMTNVLLRASFLWDEA